MTAHVARIGRLRAETRDDSPAVATPTPRLSWTVETAGSDWVQAWAELRDGSGATARVEGRDSVLVRNDTIPNVQSVPLPTDADRSDPTKRAELADKLWGLTEAA